MTNQTVVILDFGGQYKELIARRVRSMGVHSVVLPSSTSADKIRQLEPIGIILTGGPKSVYGEDAKAYDSSMLEMGIPVLGLCYGMHLLCHNFGGKIQAARVSEFGAVKASFDKSCVLFEQMQDSSLVLMSHNDEVTALPSGFRVTASTNDCAIAACEDEKRRLYAVQFHPETDLTQDGNTVIKNFLYKVCKARGDYSLDDYIKTQERLIKQQVGEGRVLLALSGGVDSSVCAALLSKIIPSKLTCIFVDHGLMRYKEGDAIEQVFSKRDLNFIRVNAEDRFLKRLAGVVEPEQKRKIIGEEFIRVFEEQAKKLGKIEFLAQGTIYPDIIESGTEASAVIKSHHNVGGLPQNLDFIGLVEPLKELFKDEVRAIGKKLGLPDSLVERQPFPGPGLGVRVIGEITKDKLDNLRLADHIFRTTLEENNLRPEQYFAIHTGVYSVGVKGDARAYEPVIALRAINTNDFMTCRYAHIPHELLCKISSKIVNECKGVSRVVYDITDKPPATVEWE